MGFTPMNSSIYHLDFLYEKINKQSHNDLYDIPNIILCSTLVDFYRVIIRAYRLYIFVFIPQVNIF